MSLWIVRHAVPLIAPGSCYGQLDVPADAALTESAALAAAQVLPMGARLRYSPLQRCERLMQALCALRPDLALDCQPDPRLMEMGFGTHEGTLWADHPLALLETGQMAGAMLDVFRTEPLPAGHPFWTHPRITVTPHTSARTLRSESMAQIVGKIQALERGEPVAGVVDLVRGY